MCSQECGGHSLLVVVTVLLLSLGVIAAVSQAVR